MTGLIIAISIIGSISLFAVIFGAIRLNKMEKDMTTLAECLLTYVSYPEKVDILEDYPVSSSDSDFDFPNSTGF